MDQTPFQPPSFRLNLLGWLGLAGLLLGTGPLVAVMVMARAGLTSDPNPNPVGFGILMFLTFWPSLTLFLIGAALSVARYARARKVWSGRGVATPLPGDPREQR